MNYTDDEAVRAYSRSFAAERGTEIHDLAARHIRFRWRVPSKGPLGWRNVNRYINDAIAYKMTPEQPLYYSPIAFGTADAISFRDGFLRIHDLKTGQGPVHIEQLLAYAALFCLEYGVDPKAISCELRIYQHAEPDVVVPVPEDILGVMDAYERETSLLLTYFDGHREELKPW